MRIATCQYSFSIQNWDAYTQKIETLIIQAKEKNANLFMLPEYAGLEIGMNISHTYNELFPSTQLFLFQYIHFFQQLACQYQLYILAGTLPVLLENEKYVNRAYFFEPSGKYAYQDKLQLTEDEKQSQLLLQGTTQTLFDTSHGKVGVAICYDCEFPEMVRALIQAGAWLILVPSYTTSLAGYYRVSISARARAIENQCYVVTSVAVGSMPLDIDEMVGLAGIYSPADVAFPADGIIAQGKMNHTEIVIGDVFSEKIDFVRKNGDVHNYEDMLQQATSTNTSFIPTKIVEESKSTC